MKKLDIDSWDRRAHFENFKEFSDPFFNITANVDVSEIVHLSKKGGISFFALSFFGVLKIVNEIESFRYRIRDGEVVIHDVIDGGCTVLNQDETFSYCYFKFMDDLQSFCIHVESVIEKNKTENSLDPRRDRDDLIHGSVLPWVSFTGFEHAKRHDIQDSIPKVVLGRYFRQDGKFQMPISVAVHHALMDGIHVGRFFQKYEDYANGINREF